MNEFESNELVTGWRFLRVVDWIPKVSARWIKIKTQNKWQKEMKKLLKRNAILFFCCRCCCCCCFRYFSLIFENSAIEFENIEVEMLSIRSAHWQLLDWRNAATSWLGHLIIRHPSHPPPTILPLLSPSFVIRLPFLKILFNWIFRQKERRKTSNEPTGQSSDSNSFFFVQELQLLAFGVRN